MIAFMLDTGVRLSEVANLRVEHLNLREREALIHGKGSKDRIVPFAQDCRDSLKLWLSYRGESEGELFWLGTDGVRMVLRKIKLQTGIQMLTAHQIRHTALTMMAVNEMGLHDIKKVAGHASITTTDAYISMANKDIKAKHEAASPFGEIAAELDVVRRHRRPLKRAS